MGKTGKVQIRSTKNRVPKIYGQMRKGLSIFRENISVMGLKPTKKS